MSTKKASKKTSTRSKAKVATNKVPAASKKIKKTKVEILDLEKESTLHDCFPRDVYGAPTGKRFEYQYEQTAKACLQLLESQENLCVFCEWHDDFVLEKKGNANAKFLYAFNQVKTRKGDQGPWSLTEIFGINTTKATPAATISKSFIFKLLRHFIDFGKSCEQIIFLTNAAIEKEARTFLDAVSVKPTFNKLSKEHRYFFDRVFTGYSQVVENLDEETLFVLLKRLDVIDEDMPLTHSNKVYRSDLMDKISEFSEIELNRKEVIAISDELLKLVREKSQTELTVKVSNSNLRKIKGVEVTDVLELLSLSKSGYAILSTGGVVDSIRKLSRLQRLLKRTLNGSKLTENYVNEMCELKVNWESWQRGVRHTSDHRVDLASLKQDVRDLLNEWENGGINFGEVGPKADAIAIKYQVAFQGLDLKKDLIFGCLLSTAVEKDL